MTTSISSTSDYFYWDISGLRYGTKYYWRVQASNALDTAEWSAVWSFTTSYQLTTGPTLVSPVNDSSDIDFQSVLALQWDTLDNVNGYRYQVSTSSDFSTIFAQGTTSQTSATIHNLRPATTYYWRVQGYNGVGNSVWSAVWHFTTNGCPPIGSSFAHEICEGDSYDFFGRTLSSSGSYTETLITELGCDSTVTLHLTVHPTVTELVEVTICESDLPYRYVNGDIDTTFGIGTPNLSTFNFQFSTSHGCDSTVILTLNIRSANYTELTETACGNYTWNDEVYEESSDYVQTFTNAAGCDSVVTLHLTIFTADSTDFADNACGSYTWNDEVYTESGDYRQTFTNAAGCDSTVTLHLTINVPTEGDTAAVACGSFSWHGYTNLTESGDYTDVLTNAAGCDSTVTLHLTINQPVVTETYMTACDEYEWNEETHTISGDYTATFTAANGCDSTVTLHLTINVPTEGDTSAVACGNFDWHGLHLTESGDYTWTGQTAAGCDSTVSLHLTINAPTESDTTATACGTFSWHGYTNLTESGDYTDILVNASGCDSVVTLHLTINTLPVVTISGATSFCEGGSTILTASGADTYEWSTTEFGAECHIALAGTYSVVGTDTNGCTATASVTVSEITISTETHVGEVGENSYMEASQDNAEYQWINCDTHEPIEGATQQQFTPVVTGSYACVITLGECTDTTECTDFSVGVEEWDDGSIILYPNPTTGIVNIHQPSHTSASLEIHVSDVYGRRMQTLSVTDAATQIDLSQYATGVYLIQWVGDGRVIGVCKVVKE